MTPIELSTVLSPALANAALLIAAPSLGCLTTYTRVLNDLCRAYSLPQPDLGHVLQYRCRETPPSSISIVSPAGTQDFSCGTNIDFQNLNTEHYKILNNLDLPEIKKDYENIKFEDDQSLYLVNQTAAQPNTSCTPNDKLVLPLSQEQVICTTPSVNTLNGSKQIKDTDSTPSIHNINMNVCKNKLQCIDSSSSSQNDSAETFSKAKPVLNINQGNYITKQYHPWSCTTCQYINYSKHTKCDRCGKLKASIEEKQTISNKGLHCPQCTFLNGKDARECEICGLSIAPIDDKHYLDIDGPECPQCTFINLRGADKCQVCGITIFSMDNKLGRVCKDCTFVNVKDEQDCNMCDHHLEGPNMSIEARVCENCTLINENFERACNGCGNFLVNPYI